MLGEFITSLLGQQQSIERDLVEPFDIDHHWIVNLHETIDQRIKTQTNSTLISFSLIIYFENGLKRTFNSFEAFEIYNETKKIIPIGIKILWNYLVKFPSKDIPEKQQITFSAHIHREKNKNRDIVEKFINKYILSNLGRYTINYQIDHTERTWGDDLEHIISNEVDKVTRNNVVKNSIYDSARILVVAMFLCVTAIYFAFNNIVSVSENIVSIISEYDSIVTKNDILTIELIDSKINYIEKLISSIANRDVNSFNAILKFSTFLAISLIILFFTRKPTYSFFVFSEETKNIKNKLIKKEKRGWLILFLSFIVSIFAGIACNYGFAWINVSS